MKEQSACKAGGGVTWLRPKASRVALRFEQKGFAGVEVAGFFFLSYNQKCIVLF